MTRTSADATSPADTTAPLLDIRDLDVTFTTSTGTVPAVRGANLCVYAGQTVAIVGESGSGTSTNALAISQLPPGNRALTGGRIAFHRLDLSRSSGRRLL